MSHNGFARTIRSAHSIYDGDTIFTLSTGEVEADINAVGSLAAETMSRAIYRAIISAESAYNLKSCKDLK